MSDAQRMNQLVQKLIHTVTGAKRSPLMFTAEAVPNIMACAEYLDDDITPDIRRQIDDLTSRIEVLESKRRDK